MLHEKYGHPLQKSTRLIYISSALERIVNINFGRAVVIDILRSVATMQNASGGICILDGGNWRMHGIISIEFCSYGSHKIYSNFQLRLFFLIFSFAEPECEWSAPFQFSHIQKGRKILDVTWKLNAESMDENHYFVCH